MYKYLGLRTNNRIIELINFDNIACSCNKYGSRSEKCDELTGQCPCKEKYVGRTCSRCEVNALSFLPITNLVFTNG